VFAGLPQNKELFPYRRGPELADDVHDWSRKMNPARRAWDISWRKTAAAALLAVATTLLAPPATASPPRGSDAPRITLSDADGGRFDSADYKGKTLVLIFGELSHEKLAQACADIDAALADPRLPKDAGTPALVMAHDPGAEGLKNARDSAHLPKLVLADAKREAFGAYHIVVVPEVVVVGPDGKVLYALPSFTPNFKETLTQALLLASGKIDAAQFDEYLAHPGAGPAVSGPEAKASRLAHLARELVRRGLPEMAEQRYREAIEASPKCAQAQAGYGELLLSQGKLDEAQARFQTALDLTPGSLDAMLGLDAVLIKRGGEGLNTADTDVRRILAGNSKVARAHYLLGLIHQQRSEQSEAAQCFKTAAELLMEPGESQ
jgi:tetratricopeptide (TPR) repeat protein